MPTKLLFLNMVLAETKINDFDWTKQNYITRDLFQLLLVYVTFELRTKLIFISEIVTEMKDTSINIGIHEISEAWFFLGDV